MKSLIKISENQKSIIFSSFTKLLYSIPFLPYQLQLFCIFTLWYLSQILLKQQILTFNTHQLFFSTLIAKGFFDKNSVKDEVEYEFDWFSNSYQNIFSTLNWTITVFCWVFWHFLSCGMINRFLRHVCFYTTIFASSLDA